MGGLFFFPPEIAGKQFAEFLVELAQLFRDQLLESIVPELQKTPPVLGLTFGADRGQLIKLIMGKQVEYLGRALNIASRLQGAVKEGDDNPAYKVLISKPTFQRLRIPPFFQIGPAKVNLRNIQLGENYECMKIVLLT